MPELPEAEYMVRRLTDSPGLGHEIQAVKAPSLGAKAARTLRGLTLTGYARRAKNVLLHCSGDWTLRVQLGMTGHVYAWPDRRQLPRFTRAHLELSNDECIVFEDARKFGSLSLLRTAELPNAFADYGPEPLDDSWTWQQLRESAAKSRGPVKPFLLDQSRVVGLGNIWAAESLWEAKINPFRLLPSLTAAEWKRLHAAIRLVLRQAIAATFEVTRTPQEFPEADLLTCRVYGREDEACRRCRRTAILRENQAGRSPFFCPHCQR
jgi:formamidopyrimidine-DNA glycosylase